MTEPTTAANANKPIISDTEYTIRVSVYEQQLIAGIITQEQFDTFVKELEDTHYVQFDDEDEAMSENQANGNDNIASSSDFDSESEPEPEPERRPTTPEKKKRLRKNVNFVCEATNKSPKTPTKTSPARTYADDDEEVIITRRQLRERDEENTRKGAKAIVSGDPAVIAYQALTNFHSGYKKLLDTQTKNIYRNLKNLRHQLCSR